ncbi:Sir2 silent information regulator family NAD-dependent deacetylase [Harryflintia acetispora]|nr:Sir2 silent information regulator family NAD-dependent deacetylase [Harryflintia acetispora]
MFSKMKITPSTAPCSEQIDRLRTAICEARAIVVGAGSGLSTSAGLCYSGPRFEEHFGDFIARYHYSDMYSAGFYPYGTPEEYWAYWSRHIYYNRYEAPVGEPYHNLLQLLEGRDYFVITTNVDHCFQRAGFDKQRLFYTQGDYGLWQCSLPCHQKTYDNEEAVRRMLAGQRDMRIPSELIPRCPVCGRPMSMSLRCDFTFVEDAGWHAAHGRYEEFLRSRQQEKILYLELGVGGNTPGIIKYPFWQLTAQNPSAAYACLNLTDAQAPKEILPRAICIEQDIGEVLSLL